MLLVLLVYSCVMMENVLIVKTELGQRAVRSHVISGQWLLIVSFWTLPLKKKRGRKDTCGGYMNFRLRNIEHLKSQKSWKSVFTTS